MMKLTVSLFIIVLLVSTNVSANKDQIWRKLESILTQLGYENPAKNIDADMYEVSENVLVLCFSSSFSL